VIHSEPKNGWKDRNLDGQITRGTFKAQMRCKLRTTCKEEEASPCNFLFANHLLHCINQYQTLSVGFPKWGDHVVNVPDADLNKDIKCRLEGKINEVQKSSDAQCVSAEQEEENNDMDDQIVCYMKVNNDIDEKNWHIHIRKYKGEQYISESYLLCGIETTETCEVYSSIGSFWDLKNQVHLGWAGEPNEWTEAKHFQQFVNFVKEKVFLLVQ